MLKPVRLSFQHARDLRVQLCILTDHVEDEGRYLGELDREIEDDSIFSDSVSLASYSESESNSGVSECETSETNVNHAGWWELTSHALGCVSIYTSR